MFASGRLFYRLDSRIDSPIGPQQQQPQQQVVGRFELEPVKVMVFSIFRTAPGAVLQDEAVCSTAVSFKV
jgi:hypothetical protein